MVDRHTCNRCGHTWVARKQDPGMCPSCKTMYWRRPPGIPVVEYAYPQNAVASSAIVLLEYMDGRGWDLDTQKEALVSALSLLIINPFSGRDAFLKTLDKLLARNLEEMSSDE